jgi:glutamate dehydrogenase/leucine dehydrogenase
VNLSHQFKIPFIFACGIKKTIIHKKTIMKVTVVGAGNVGATCAQIVAEKNIVSEVVLLDIKEGLSEGKSLDLWQTAPINYYDTRLV